MRKIHQYLLLIALLAGCSGDGIFYNLENEEKIEDANNLSDSISLDQMLIYSDQYVINGKKVWHSTRGAETNKWFAYPVPSGYKNDATFPSIGLLNGNLYATIISQDADSRAGLLKYNSGSGSWEELVVYEQSSSGSSDFTFYNMYLFETSLGLYVNLVQYYKDSDFEIAIRGSNLYFFSHSIAGETALAAGLTATNEVTFPGFLLDSSTDDPMPIVGIVSAGADLKETYMVYNLEGSDFKSGVLAYSAADDPLNFAEVSTGLSEYNYTSIYYSQTHDMLFMGTKADDDEHPILYETDGTWYSTIWNNDIQFSTFYDISGIQADTILAGTQAFKDPTSSSSISGDGYIEIIVTDKVSPTLQSNNFSNKNNYGSSDLEDATVKDLLYDSTYGRLYATTTSSGLWLNTLSGSERKWAQE